MENEEFCMWPGYQRFCTCLMLFIMIFELSASDSFLVWFKYAKLSWMCIKTSVCICACHTIFCVRYKIYLNIILCLCWASLKRQRDRQTDTSVLLKKQRFQYHNSFVFTCMTTLYFRPYIQCIYIYLLYRCFFIRLPLVCSRECFLPQFWILFCCWCFVFINAFYIWTRVVILNSIVFGAVVAWFHFLFARFFCVKLWIRLRLIVKNFRLRRIFNV